MTASIVLKAQSVLDLHTGRSIPHIGFGTGGLGAGTEDAVKHAFKSGYRLVDSGQRYGNEADVGRAIAASSVPRSELFVITKYCPPFAPSDPILSAPEVLQTVRDSLEKLFPKEQQANDETRYIDLMMIHHCWPNQEARENAWEGLMLAKEEGLVKDIGVSNFGISHLERLPPPVPVVNQIEMHPFCQQREVVAYCQARGILISAYSPTAHFLEEKIGNPIIVKLCEKHKRTAGHILLRWSLQKGFIPIPRSSNPGRIEDNIDLFSFELTADDMDAIDSLNEGAAGHITPVDPANLPE
ncbi:hypothetical protein IAR55_005162 [Kwoniella newhampshirensis]|uniref:NADP-dependent oxidoreductase domain-containing protein n=1 Tax=Kwoniella newhampshirensis TaxID=1651941 RepID=A0AAW0YK60_9TREE